MTEERLPHLTLPRLDLAAPRRRQRGGPTRRRDDAAGHGTRLSREVQTVAGQLAERRDRRPLGIDPRLVFLVELGAGTGLDDEAVADMGLHVLAADGRQRLVVFPDDSHLARLQARISAYQASDGARYQATAAVEGIRSLGPDDRMGPRLAADPLTAGERAALDVELWHSGDQAQMNRLVDDLRRAIAPNASVTDQYVGLSLCLLRVRVDQVVLNALLDLDHVKEIERRAEPTFELIDLIATPLEAYAVGNPPADEAPGIVIVDSGVYGDHPVLVPVHAEARSYVVGDPSIHPTHGHGTWVAGIAAYGDVAESIARRQFEPSVRIYSAKVMATANSYDPDQLVETQLRRVIEELTSDYPSIKVVNLSLGDSRTPYVDGGLQFRLAATIDELAYEFRDRELIFVVSAGNQNSAATGEVAVETYPEYLFEEGSRIIDPATASIALTVGAISSGEGAQPPERTATTDRGVAEHEWPSAFTRTGPGHAGAIKPELVEYAGDARFSMGRLLLYPRESGLPTTSDEFAPPTGQLFRTVAGTSFAAPKVSHLAARLFDTYDQASSNLIRALLADSAHVPDSRPPSLERLAPDDPKILFAYGYGRPDLDLATYSLVNRAVLLADESMPLDHVYLYEIPPLPTDFREARGRGRISVTLAYDPPTRHTRSKEYLGVRMQFALFRNASAEAVYDAVRVWSTTEAEQLEGGVPGRRGLSTVDLEPGPNLRNKGTLQRGVELVSSTRWQYNDEALILAVTCQRRWAPDAIDRQRFAVVVTVAHENPNVEVYSTIAARTAVYQQVRVRVPA